MDVKITYPTVKKRVQRRKMLDIVRWPFLAAAVICPAVNIALGGKAWSVIVLMGLYMVWTLVLSPALVEYNRISQPVRVLVCSAIMLALIDALIAPGWAMEVVPLVCVGGLTAVTALFFSDMRRQSQNMLPMLFYIFCCVAFCVLGLALGGGKGMVYLIVMGSLAILLLAACAVATGGDFVRELKRRFHTK